MEVNEPWPGGEANAELLALLEGADDAVVGSDLGNRIVRWNAAAERLFGYRPDEILGKPREILLPQDRPDEVYAITERIARGERVERFETVRRTRSGHLIDVTVAAMPVTDASGAVVGSLTFVRDNREQKEQQRTLDQLKTSAQNRALVLDTANRVALDILARRSGVDALHHIASAARVLANARYAALGVATSDGTSLSEFVTVGLTREEERRIGNLPKGAGVLGLLLKRTEPLRIDVLGKHPSSVGFPPNHPPMESFLGVPIRRGNTVLGSLYLTNKHGGGSFTEADEVAVQALGSHAAVAIHNLQMLSRQRALVSGLIAAQEEERRAVAYDLHDGLTQYVMASHAHLEAFRRANEAGKTERAARELDNGLRYLKEAVIESRRLVNGLRSLALDDLGLAGALELQVNEEKARAGWDEADFIHNIAGKRYDKSLETAVYRVAQEAMTNARKHAETKRVRVLLLHGRDETTGGESLTLEIRDWGRGFHPDRHTETHGHVGLQSMFERVRLMDGSFEIRSAPGEGTVIRAVIPAQEPESDDLEEGGSET